MKPGERVELIKRIASFLCQFDYGTIDLILEQFGLPTYSQWNGEMQDYAIACVKDGNDDTLVELDEYLRTPDDAERVPDQQGGHWEAGSFRLFLCHVHQEADFTSQLKGHLQKFAIDAFVAHKDVNPSDEWQVVIENSLATCDAFVPLLHEGFAASKWCDQECGFALARRVLILAIKFAHDPYGFIGRFQALSGKDKNPRDLARELFDFFRNHELTALKVTEALVTRLENAADFSIAVQTSKLLYEVSHWTPDLLRRMEAAVELNDQVGGAYWVPDRIRSIVERVQTSAASQ